MHALPFFSNTLVILSGHTAMQKAADMSFQFAQEAHFLWLTGINEPDWWAIVERGVLTLVAPERDETQVLFEGGISRQEAKKLSGASEVITQKEGEALLRVLAERYDRVAAIGPDPYAKHHSFVENPAPGRLFKKLNKIFRHVDDCRADMAKIRAVKSDAEVQLIREAIDASIGGFERVSATIREYTHEYEIEAVLNAAFRRTGAGGHAYDPIVAGGKNACTLHYNTNNDQLPKNGLVLIDAGAKVGGYAADITRTYALGTPSERERAVHAAVEAAHYAIISLIKPGVSFKAYQESVDEIMKDALQKLGLLDDRADQKTYRKYFPHAVSHGLGLDVHESLGGFGEFKPGMVLTVEPGIYIPEEGIGVRIEDDILVTETGAENLSAALPTSL